MSLDYLQTHKGQDQETSEEGRISMYFCSYKEGKCLWFKVIFNFYEPLFLWEIDMIFIIILIARNKKVHHRLLLMDLSNLWGDVVFK